MVECKKEKIIQQGTETVSLSLLLSLSFFFVFLGGGSSIDSNVYIYVSNFPPLKTFHPTSFLPLLPSPHRTHFPSPTYALPTDASLLTGSPALWPMWSRTSAPTPLAVSDTLCCCTRVGDLKETKRIAAVTPRAKSGKRDMAGRTRGQGETAPEPIGLDLCPHLQGDYQQVYNTLGCWHGGGGRKRGKQQNDKRAYTEGRGGGIRRRGMMGREREGGCRQESVYLRGVPSHGLEDGVGKKKEIIQQGTETVSLSLKLSLKFFFFFFLSLSFFFFSCLALVRYIYELCLKAI